MGPWSIFKALFVCFVLWRLLVKRCVWGAFASLWATAMRLLVKRAAVLRPRGAVIGQRSGTRKTKKRLDLVG
jgi:hypothetical protein